jgi:hypothetical protein
MLVGASGGHPLHPAVDQLSALKQTAVTISCYADLDMQRGGPCDVRLVEYKVRSMRVSVSQTFAFNLVRNADESRIGK